MTIAYGLFCVLGGAIVLRAGGRFNPQRAFGQGIGICALGLATAWTWFFLSAGGDAETVAHGTFDLLLALAVLVAACNHGWPLSLRFGLLAGGFGLIAVGDAIGAYYGSADFAALANPLPFAGAALIVAAACLGIGPPAAAPRSGRPTVVLALVAVFFAVTALVFDHYSRLSTGTMILASMTVAGAGIRLTLAQRGWRDTRARARRAEAPTSSPALDAVLALGADHLVVSCNELAEGVFRRRESEIVGKPVADLLGGFAEGRSFEDLLADADRQALPLSVELYAYDGNGNEFPVEVGISPARARGAEWALVVRDISERRRREEDNRRLAAIIRSSEDAVLTKDLNGVITAWNQGAERLYGYRAEEAIDRRVTDLIIPPERISEADRVLGQARKGETISFETQRIPRTGSSSTSPCAPSRSAAPPVR